MYDIDYVKEHINEFEEDEFLDRRFTKRFVDFLPTSEWDKFIERVGNYPDVMTLPIESEKDNGEV